METLLDVLQFVLFLFFLVAGGAKLIWAREGFKDVLPYAEDFSDTGFKQLGLVELIAALGLAISLATDTPDWVAPVSALLLAGLQITVGVLHWRRTGNQPYLRMTTLLAIIALVVAWGRIGPYPL